MDYPDIAPDFGHWLAGFMDGEGHFGIRRRPKGVAYYCRIQIMLRADDKLVLEEVQQRTGLGTVLVHSHVSWGSDQVQWTDGSKQGCLRAVEIFECYPLRAKKARDFEVWAEAVRAWHAHDWARMAVLHDDLRSGREYLPGETLRRSAALELILPQQTLSL